MSDKLPNFIDPVYCANNHKQFVYSVNQELFPRLVELAASAGSQVQVDASFEYDKFLRAPVLTLELKTDVNLTCQRSLETFSLPINSRTQTAFVESMALTDEFPAGIEIQEMDEDKVSLFDLIEDELLLNIPMVPINEASDMNYQNTDEVVEATEEGSTDSSNEKQNPFAVLKGLKD